VDGLRPRHRAAARPVLGTGKVCHTGSRSCFTQELPLAGAALPGKEEVQR
jgi:hypothetical protein